MDIIDKESMKQYIAIELGEPIIKVELHDVHYEQSIKKALELMHRYSAGEGSYYEYGLIELEAGKTEYNLRSVGEAYRNIVGKGKPPTQEELKQIKEELDTQGWENCTIDIESIIDIKSNSSLAGSGGINDLFTPAHGWFYNGGGAQSMGLNPTSGVTNYGQANPTSYGGYNNGNIGNEGMFGNVTGGSPMAPVLPLSNFVQFKQQIKLLDRMFGEKILHVFRPQAGMLSIMPTPRKNSIAVMRYWKKEEAVYLYNNPLFKEAAVAFAGEQWGENITKYTNAMAGGGQVNGEAILSMYREKLEKISTKIENESWAPMFRRG